MTFSVTGHREIDVERLVSDPHCTASQLDWFSVFAHHQFIMLKALQRRLFWCRLGCFLERSSTSIEVETCTAVLHQLFAALEERVCFHIS